jgi:hypothetical protein
MSAYDAESGLVDAGNAHSAAAPPPPEDDEDDDLRPARGVISNTILSVPFWMLIAFVVYSLLWLSRTGQRILL